MKKLNFAAKVFFGLVMSGPLFGVLLFSIVPDRELWFLWAFYFGIIAGAVAGFGYLYKTKSLEIREEKKYKINDRLWSRNVSRNIRIYFFVHLIGIRL